MTRPGSLRSAARCWWRTLRTAAVRANAGVLALVLVGAAAGALALVSILLGWLHVTAVAVGVVLLVVAGLLMWQGGGQ